MNEKERIDLYLVEKKICASRSIAQELIHTNQVLVNNKIINKTNHLISIYDCIKVIPPKYVSRGGYKLEKAIEMFNINLYDKVVLDIGASTGGFTDCCIKHGAKHVYALDVGTNQLHPTLKNSKQVTCIENTNLKNLINYRFEQLIDFIVCDVSFISLKHVFSSITNFYNHNLKMIFLIKPQFELDKKTLTKTKGLIKNNKHHKQAIENVINYAKQHNVILEKIIESPILGKKLGNKEFIGLFKWIK